MKAQGQTVSCSRPVNGTVVMRLAGVWKTGRSMPSPPEAVRGALAIPGIRCIAIDSSDIEVWDTSLTVFLEGLLRYAGERGVAVDLAGLPAGAVRLIEIAQGSGERKGLPGAQGEGSFPGAVGSSALALERSAAGALAFIGDAFLALFPLFGRRPHFRGSDLVLFTYECGMQALPIVSLISMLVGLILSFVGIVELRKFGVEIYVADLVGITMAREMGPMMTAMIMAGRTGAAYATQLATMEANEEVDALKTLGISPMEFLVLPRTLALTLMMPLLCVYADFMGILGGGLVGVGLFGIPFGQYYAQSVGAIKVMDFAIGVVKSAFFAQLIGLSSCFYGMRSERSASAVGYAATRSVVAGIVLVVVADGIFAVVTTALGI